MKNVMIAFVILATVSMTAQRGPRGDMREKGADLTAAQIATLQTKKMTLALDLEDAQSKKVYDVLLSQAEDRKAMMAERKAQTERPELSKDERYKKMNERLDKQIAFQNDMQRILSDEQYDRFKKIQGKRKNKRDRKGLHERRGARHKR